MKDNGPQSAIDRCFDVTIVGGGPAGSAAAIWCALSGLEVAVIESAKFPRHRPGESLHPGVLPILRQLGVGDQIEEAGFFRYPGQTVVWGSNPIFQAFGNDETGPWMGLQAIREKFDAILLERAKSLGVVMLQPCDARSPVIEGRRIVGIDSSKGQIRSRWVIDATGRRHWLGRKIGGGIYCASKQLIAHYGYANSRMGNTQVFPKLEADRDGWTWISPIGNGSCAWVRLPFQHVRGRLEAPPRELDGFVPLGPTRAADVSWRLLTNAAGPGYFVVGDAMSVLDPLSSHGVLKALMSGMQAAHLVGLVLRKGINELIAIRSYKEWCLQLFSHEVQNMRELYARLPANAEWLLSS